MSSLGLHVRSDLPTEDLRSIKEADEARIRADVFFAMLLIPEFDEHGEPCWKPERDKAKLQPDVLPWYRTLEQAGIVDHVKPHPNEMSYIRNGFDHARTTNVNDGQQLKALGATLVAGGETAPTAFGESLPPTAHRPVP